ncbi:MAG: ABC transporter permease, partial [Anaerolineae bacterium]|nr:ABC transporter permease [Anaerolineae bacterium]
MRDLQAMVNSAARLLRFAVKHSLRDMGRNRARTAFALVCVAAGVSAIVALRSLAFMVGDELTTNLAQVNRGDIRVYATRSVPELIELSSQNSPVFTQRTVGLVRAWAAREGVAVSFARLSEVLPLRPVAGGEDRSAQTVLSLYVETEVYPYYDTIMLREPAGVTLRDLFVQHGAAGGTLDDPRPIVISTGLARSVGMGLGLGDIVRLGAAEVYYVVRGIAPSTAETVLTWPMAAFLGTYVYLPLEDLALAGEAPLPDEIFVKVPLGQDIAETEASLVAYLQEQTGAKTDLEQELSRVTVLELAENNAEVAGVIDDLILVIGLSSLLIGGIGIVNTMLVVVNRRMLEIAVLKTLGLKAYRVTLLFLVEALLLGAAGSVIGVGVGVALSYLVRGVGEEAFALTLEWRLYPVAMGSGLFLGVLITALFGFMPTLIAGQVRPAMVLRPNEAELPAVGLIQTLLTLLVMIAVLGALVSSIVGGAFAVGPVIMIAGGGALIGLFVGVIAANRRHSAPAGSQRRLYHWLGAGAWFAVHLYGALAVGAALASGVLLVVGAIWRPFGLGDADLPDTIVEAVREGEWVWALIWALLTGVVARAVWRHAGRAARTIALAALGLTVGGALGAAGGLALERLAGGTGLWRALASVSTGIVLVEGAIALLSAIYVGYWLLVWGVARLRPVAMSGITSGLMVGLVAGLGAVASLAGRAALVGTLVLIGACLG